jgi:uncharacterized protein (TIGR02266 family)
MTGSDDNGHAAGRAGALVIQLEYSSAGAFLVAYATELSKGSLFIETETPPPLGTSVFLALHVPGQEPIEVQGRVAWLRDEAVGPGMPPGISVEISTPADQYGGVVDRVAFGFSGINILLGTGEPAPRAILARYMRSILTCEIADVDYEKSFDVLPAMIDLAVIDLDSSGTRGDELIHHLRVRNGDHLPIITLAQLERDRVRAQELGASDAVSNPPLFAELSATVLRCIGRPSRVTQGSSAAPG